MYLLKNALQYVIYCLHIYIGVHNKGYTKKNIYLTLLNNYYDYKETIKFIIEATTYK